MLSIPDLARDFVKGKLIITLGMTREEIANLFLSYNYLDEIIELTQLENNCVFLYQYKNRSIYSNHLLFLDYKILYNEEYDVFRNVVNEEIKRLKLDMDELPKLDLRYDDYEWQ